MPYAASKKTGKQWANSRGIDWWVVYAGDLSAAELAEIGGHLAGAKKDGAGFVVIEGAGQEAHPAERALADVVLTAPFAPLPYGIFAAMQAVDAHDVRKVGVIAGGRAAIAAGHQAGCGAIVAIAAADPAYRRPLVLSQPDHIVTADEFGALYAARYGTKRGVRDYVLLNPGPSVTTDRVHRAIAGADMCHREPEYSDLFSAVRSKLLTVAGVADDWAVVLIAGSGTAAMEAMTGSLTRPGRKLLVLKNGIYGERIETIAKRRGDAVVTINAGDLEPIDPAAVAAALDADPTIDAVAVIHHETTTGLLNPVHEIAREAKKRGVLVGVDAISSFGAEDLDVASGLFDFVATTSNKCLHGLPGIGILLVSPAGQQRIGEVPPTSLYFDLANYLKAQAKRTVPFTPAVQVLYSLDAALDELLDEGVEHRRRAYQARMDYIDRALPELGLEPRVAAAVRSRCVRSLPLPAGIDYDTLHDALKADGYVVYAGLGDAAKTTFRVCALGAITVEALEGFVESLKHIMETKGR
jgi:2-aminoethylphosphonate-pyruvate transaminase